MLRVAQCTENAYQFKSVRYSGRLCPSLERGNEVIIYVWMVARGTSVFDLRLTCQ